MAADWQTVAVTSQAVSWRRAVVAVVVVALALGGTIVALRSDGFSAVDATVPRATRWFVHQASGRVVLADGFSGRALARLDAIAGVGDTEVAQGAAGAAVIDRNESTARAVDPTALRLGSPQPLSIVDQPDAVIGVGQPGLVAVDPDEGAAVLLPLGGEPVSFDVPVSTPAQTRVATDGAVWTVSGGSLTRTTTSSQRSSVAVSANGRLALVGAAPLVFDPDRGVVSFAEGDPIALPDDVPPSEVVLQADGPSASCGWLGANDRLWCVGEGGIEESVVIDGLDIDGGDLLGIAGDAGALVRRGAVEIVRIDWRRRQVADGDIASVPIGAQLDIAVGPDLVWVDHTDGNRVWAINPWGIRSIPKDDASVPLIGETGEIVGPGGDGRPSPGVGNDPGGAGPDNPPDDDGIDDPPVAIDDPVTARSGTQVPIDVTANDFDPDGEAIAVIDVDAPRNGQVEISSASTVTYRPDSGYVGTDQFDYTIADGAGTEATATVTVELLSPDAPNREPVGADDFAETGAGAEVVIDVLLNDIDPERDALRIASFTQPDVGSVVEVRGQAGLAALRYEPPLDASGSESFTYRPVDSLGAIGDPVTVDVDIAATTAENRPPVLRPDAVLVRRDRPATVAVLANDRDPDGDRLTVSLVRPLPDGIDARVEGNDVVVTARAGVSRLTPFGYRVDDGNGHEVDGNLLVALLDESEPNRAPLATPDSATVVAGTIQLIDVLANDSDPDGDPISLVGVRRTTTGGAISVRGNRVAYVAPPPSAADDQLLDHFEYTISDGRGQRSTGEVTVRILPELVPEPPFAQDDVATTDMNEPVTIDVLRNDGDPSGERPSLVGTPGCASGGTATVVGDDVRFDPPTDQTGRFVCRYEITNSQGLRASASIVVSVIQPEVANQPPDPVDDERTLGVEETIRIDPLANDSDPDGDPIRLLSFSLPIQGTATADGNSIVFTAGSTADVVTITYEVADDSDARSTGNIVITITAPDPVPPNATDDRRTINGPGVTTVLDVLSNDDDPDGDNADLVIIDAVLVSGDGRVEFSPETLTFSPDEDFAGDLVARYTISDPDGFTAQATATLTVLEPANRPPVAGNDSAEVISGGTVTVSLGQNDSDPDGDSLTYGIVSPPDSSLGLASLDGSSLVFSASPGASGVARIVYRISDGDAEAEATVTIRIIPCGSADPLAPDAFFETGYRQPITIDLTQLAENGEITDVGPPLSAPIGTYTPPEGENGNISFTYVVRNDCGLQAVGTVTIDVNQDPVGSSFSTTISRDKAIQIPISVLASDDEPLRITGLVGAPSWVTVIDDDQALLVDPGGRSGDAQFEVVIADPGGLAVSVPVTVTLVNQPPVANDDQVASNGSAVTLEPLANDSDPDGDPISLAAVPGTFTLSDGTTATVTRDGNSLLLDPNGGSGQGSFTYTIVDEIGLVSEPATVTLTVNSPPIVPGRIDVTIAAGNTDDVVVTASDPDGDPLTLTVVGVAAPLTASASGLTVTITVDERTVGGVFEVRFRVTDTNGAFAEGSIFVTVTPPVPTTTTTTAPPPDDG